MVATAPGSWDERGGVRRRGVVGYFQDFQEYGLEAAGGATDGEVTEDAGAALEAHLPGALGVGEQLADGVGHGGGVAHGDEEAGDAVLDDLRARR
jgi:hypothetical protein